MDSRDVDRDLRPVIVPRRKRLPDRLPWATAVVTIAFLALGLWAVILLIGRSFFN